VVAVSIDISPTNMNRSGLSPHCTKADGLRINGGRIKAIDAENCHVDVVGAVRVNCAGLTARSNVYGNQSLSLEINSTEIALSHPRKPNYRSLDIRQSCLHQWLGCQDSDGNVLSPAFRHPRKHRVRGPPVKPMIL
jgi:hypothetical protein